jgi:hypothetical protein
MQNHSKPAIVLIAILSLLLGLSIGQHYRQYRQIQDLKNTRFYSAPHLPPRHPCSNHQLILINSFEETENRKAYRAEIEAIKAKMRQEREQQLQELRREIKRVRELWRRGA